MNILRLMINSVHKFCRKNFFSFMIIVVSLITAIFGMLYYSGTLWDRYYLFQYDKGASLEVTLSNDDNCLELVQKLDELTSCGLKKQLFLEKKLDVETESMGETENKYFVVGEYSTDNGVMAGRYFESGENAASVLLTEDIVVRLGLSKVVGSEIDIDGNKFKVIGMRGIQDYSNTYVVPKDYFISHYKVGYIKFVYNRYLKKAEYEKINAYLRDNKAVETYCMPTKVNPLESQVFRSQLFRIVLIFGIVLINVFVMLYFWVYCNKTSFLIYKLCGACNAVNRVIIIGSTMLVVFISDLIGCILFAMFYSLLYSNISANITVWDYGSIVLVELLLTLLFSAVIAIKVTKNKDIYKVSGE